MNGVANQMKSLSKISLPTARVSSQYFAAKGMVNLTNIKPMPKLPLPSANAIPGNHTLPPVDVSSIRNQRNRTSPVPPGVAAYVIIIREERKSHITGKKRVSRWASQYLSNLSTIHIIAQSDSAGIPISFPFRSLFVPISFPF